MGGVEDFKNKVKEMADKARAKAQQEQRHERKPGQSDIDRLKQRLSERAEGFRHRGKGSGRS